MFNKKTFRYYYWLVLEFVKKHVKLILLSFFLTFIFIISFISLSPYLVNLLISKQDVIGMVGNYDINSLPEEITDKISAGLLLTNEKGQLIPAITSTWDITNKGKTYVFHLKDNLFWEDGRAFVSRDIPYSFKDITFKNINDKTIEFDLRSPLGIFPTYLTKPIIRQPLIGIAGLYKVDHLVEQFGMIKEVSLTPNKKGLPGLKYKFYTDETQLLTSYKKGEITQFTTTKKSVADIFNNWKNTQVSKDTDYTRLLTIFYNMASPALKEKEIRQAIATAIDPKLLQQYGELANGPMPPISWAYDPDLKVPLYDPDTAGKIIKKSISATDSAKMTLSTYYDYLDIADKVVANLQQVGLNPQIHLESFTRPLDFDLLLAFWKVPSDPDQYYFWHTTQIQGNIGGYKNVKVDKLLEDGRNTLNLDERKAIYFDFQKVMLDDPPAAFLYYPYVYTIKRK